MVSYTYATHGLMPNQTLVYSIAVGFANISHNSNVYEQHSWTFLDILRIEAHDHQNCLFYIFSRIQ